MPTPPKPQAIKRLAGNPGHRPLQVRQRRRRCPVCRQCPAWLPALGRKCWRELGPVLMAAGLLTAADLPAFASLCGAYGRFVEAEKQVKLRGPVIRTPAGLEQRNPWLLVSDKARDQLAEHLRDFGGTPASRSKAAVAASDSGPASLADILFGGLAHPPAHNGGHDDAPDLLAELRRDDDQSGVILSWAGHRLRHHAGGRAPSIVRQCGGSHRADHARHGRLLSHPWAMDHD